MNITLGELDQHMDAQVRMLIKTPEFAALIRSLKLESQKAMGDAMGKIDPTRMLAGNETIPSAALDSVALSSRLRITSDVLEGMLDTEKLAVYGSIHIHL